MKPDNYARLKHIQESINKIQEIFDEMDYEEFLEDWRSRDAVIRNFEIIGEASNRMSKDLIEKYPEIEWIPAIEMRNFLIHEYFEVDSKAVWKTIEIDLPKFKKNIERILKIEF